MSVTFKMPAQKCLGEICYFSYILLIIHLIQYPGNAARKTFRFVSQHWYTKIHPAYVCIANMLIKI